MGAKPTLPDPGDCLVWLWPDPTGGDEDTYPDEPPEYVVRSAPEQAARSMAEQMAHEGPDYIDDGEEMTIATLDHDGNLRAFCIRIERTVKTHVISSYELDPEDP